MPSTPALRPREPALGDEPCPYVCAVEVAAVTPTQLTGGLTLAPLRWRATFGWQLAGFQLTKAERQEEDVARLGARLLEWIVGEDAQRSCLAAGAQLQLFANPDDYRMSLRLIVETDVAREASARHVALGFSDSLGQIAQGSAMLRWEPIRQLDQLRAATGYTGWSMGKSAVSPGWTTSIKQGHRVEGCEARDPGGAAGLGEVVRLMLAQRACNAVCVSVSGHHDARGIRERLDATSRVLAYVRTRLEGIRFGRHHQPSVISAYPEDLLEMEFAFARLRAHADWLEALRAQPVRCRVDVLGVEGLSPPLIHAVQRTVVGMPTAVWSTLSPEQAALVAHGPLCALECPRSGGSDTVVDRRNRTLEYCVPGHVAVLSLPLPLPGVDGLPGLPLNMARRRLAPNRLRGRSGGLLGTAEGTRGQVPVRLGGVDLARHLYCVGKTGVGKSTALATLFADLALRGHGVGIIDPHGDVAEALERKLDGRRNLVIFDPVRHDCPGLDPLWNNGTVESRERAIEEITSIIFRVFPREHMGPQFDRFSRCLLVPLVAARRPLADVARMISDLRFRKDCVSKLDSSIALDAEVKRFWDGEYALWDGEYRGQMINYTVSKYEALVKSSHLRRVCSSDREQLDLQGVADRGDVLLARLPQGTVGPVSAWFLGMLLASRLFDVIFTRASSAETERRPFTLFLDEFQNLLGGGGFGYTQQERTLAPLLAESRKFGLRLVLANQYVHQLDTETKEAILGNVGSMVAFRLGSTDSELLTRELGADVTPEELRSLPLYQSVARLLIDGEPTPLFSMRTIPPAELDGWLTPSSLRAVR